MRGDGIPLIIWKGDGIPQIIKCQGGCYSCSIPPNQVSCYQFTTTRQFATTRPPNPTRCKCEKVIKKFLARNLCDMWVPVLKKIVKNLSFPKKGRKIFSIPQIKFYHYSTAPTKRKKVCRGASKQFIRVKLMMNETTHYAGMICVYLFRRIVTIEPLLNFYNARNVAPRVAYCEPTSMNACSVYCNCQC
jgi:hypothetical protein